MGAQGADLLGLVTTCSSSAVKNDSSAPSSRALDGAPRAGPELPRPRRRSPAGPCTGAAEVVHAGRGGEPRQRPAPPAVACVRREGRRRGAGEVERLADEADVGVGRGGRVVGHQETGERRRQPLDRAPAAERAVCRAARVCSCWRRREGRSPPRPAGGRPARAARPSTSRRRSPTRPPALRRRARTTGSRPTGRGSGAPRAPCRSRRRGAAPTSRYWLTYSSLVRSIPGAARATSWACTTSTSRATGPSLRTSTCHAQAVRAGSRVRTTRQPSTPSA